MMLQRNINSLLTCSLFCAAVAHAQDAESYKHADLADLRRAYLEGFFRAKKKVGKKFSQRAFNEALIGHGSVAVKHLARYLVK
jgi:hypothetical protein